MKKLSLILALLFAIPAMAQIGGGQTNIGGGQLVQTFPGVPTGSCFRTALAINLATGGLYDCLSGSWNLVGGTGGSSPTGAAGGNLYGTYPNPSVASIAGALVADQFAGADICAQVIAAEAALPSTGGVVLLSAINYPACASSITITKNNFILRGAGPGAQGGTAGGTSLNFPAGVPGIIVTARQSVIEGMSLISASNSLGTDDGILMTSIGYPTVRSVNIYHFGRHGINFVGSSPTSNNDGWLLEKVSASNNFGDGFHWDAPCSDNHLGWGTILSSVSNAGWGYAMNCGSANVLTTSQAVNNTAGGWSASGTGSFFYNAYGEGGTGDSFVFQSTAVFNTVTFSDFGQPTTITDATSGTGGNIINYVSPATTISSTYLAVAGLPGSTGNTTYKIRSGSSGTSQFSMDDSTNGVTTMVYSPTNKWQFTPKVTFGTSIGLGSAGGKALFIATNPTISSGFGTGAAFSAGNGAATFRINVGTGGTASSGVIGMPAVFDSWNCSVQNLTAHLNNRADDTVQTASTFSGSVTVQNQTKSTGTAIAWTASDIITLQCSGE